MITKKKKREELQLLRDEALDAYLNREDFQYDVNADALYRHYKDQYTELGKRAMQDTMGQASALTGGYGSSYAQNVGQQAYNSYMKQLGDVVPALYQLAYQKYQDEGNRLYKTYQSWADLEQQAAQQERWEREYELEERKRQDANRRFELEQERKNSQTQTAAYQPDYWASLAAYHKLGQNTGSNGTAAVDTTTAAEPEYDNGKVSEGNIKTMQRVLGLKETGKWTDDDRTGAGGLTADKAWEYYQKGQLQNYKSIGLSLPIGNIKTMERVLGLEEDGYWSEEDQKVAGGLTAHAAWKDYQQGKLQSRSRSGMSMKEWADLKKKQSSSSNASNTKENTPAVQNFISGMVTEDQAAERGVNSTEWKIMVVDRLNRVNMTMNEFEQLEKYYGLDIPGSSSAIPQGNTANHAAQKMSYAEYRQKTAAQKVSDLNTAVQQYFNAYQLFVNSSASDIQYAGYNNAASMLKVREGTAKELQKQAEILAAALRMNGDIISGDYSELLTQIISTKTGLNSIMDAFGGQANYYSQWDTEEEYNAFAKYQNMSSDEIAAERAARADAAAEDKKDHAIVWELSQTLMPYDWESANYHGYSKEEFNDVERKRRYIEEKYGVDLHADIYGNVHIYNGLLDKLSSSYGDIAYTTKDGQNVTLQMLYDWKFAEEDLANRLDTYSKNGDWDKLSKGMDVNSDPDRKNDYSIVFELSRTNVAYDKETALANGTSEAEWNDIDQKRQYINRKYGVDLHGNIYDDAHILNEIIQMLDEKSWESGELSMQLHEDFISDRTFKNMRHLTEDEKAVLNYIFYTQGRDAALQWHNSRMSIYQDRANGVLTAEMFDWGKESPFLSSVASVAMSLGSGFEQIGDWISGDYNNSLARATSAIRSGVSEKTDLMIGNWDAFDFLYNTGMSGVDSLAASVLPGGAGSVLLGLSAAAQATNDALDRGMSQKQAFWNGLAAGIFEGVFEKWSIGNFRGLKEVASTYAKDIAKNIAKSMLVNASEETLTEIANIAYDTIINGDFSQYETKARQYVLNGMTEAEAKKKAALDLGGQVVESGASGTLMGFGFGVTGSASAVVQNVSNKVKSNQALKGQEYAQLKDAAPQIIAQALSLNPDNIRAKQLMAQLNSGKGFSVGDLQTLKTLAEESAAVTSKTPKNTAEVGVKYSLRESADNQAFVNGNAADEHVSVTPEGVSELLRSKGVNSKTTADIADAIAASLNGQELTKTQRERLSSALGSPAVQSVISDMQKTLTSRGDKVSQKPTANVGQLYTTVQAANNQASAAGNQEDVAKRLLEKGFYSKEAAGVAEAVTASLNGQDLTRTQRSILSSALSSSAVRDTISEFMQKKAEFMQKKADGVDSAQKRMYDGKIISDGLTDEEKAALWDLAHQRASAFSNHDYAIATEASVPHQVQKTLSAETDKGGRKAISQLLKDTTCSADELFVYLSKQVGSDAAEAFAKNRTWPSEVQIPKNSSALNSDGSMNWSRASQGGYTLDANGNAIKEAFAPKIGEVIDRYGAANGRYASPVIDGKAFSYSERALPYVEDVSKYHRYEITGDFTKIEEYVKNCENSELKAKIDAAVTAYYDGDYSKLVSYRGVVAEIEDWGKGGATQYEFSLSIEQLVELGLLKEIR